MTKISNPEGETVLDVIRNGNAQVVINTMDKKIVPVPTKMGFQSVGKQSNMGFHCLPHLTQQMRFLKSFRIKSLYDRSHLSKKIWNNRLRRTVPDSFYEEIEKSFIGESENKGVKDTDAEKARNDDHCSSKKQLAPRIYQLDLQGELVKEMTRPGQFVHIKVPRADLLFAATD